MYSILMLIFVLANIKVVPSAEIISTAVEDNLDVPIDTSTYSTLNEEADLQPLDILEYESRDNDDDFTSPRTTTAERSRASLLSSEIRMEDDEVEKTRSHKGRNLLLYLTELPLTSQLHLVENPLHMAVVKFTSELVARLPPRFQQYLRRKRIGQGLK